MRERPVRAAVATVVVVLSQTAAACEHVRAADAARCLEAAGGLRDESASPRAGHA